MGHGWTREIPIARRGILQRRGLLRVSVRREQREELSKPGKLEGGVSRAGVAVGPGELSVYRFRKQNRPRRRTIESGVGEESVVLLRGSGNACPHFETSAKEDSNVQEAFECAARNALKNDVEDEVYLPDTIVVNKNGSAKSGCC